MRVWWVNLRTHFTGGAEALRGGTEGPARHGDAETQTGFQRVLGVGIRDDMTRVAPRRFLALPVNFVSVLFDIDVYLKRYAGDFGSFDGSDVCISRS